MAARKPKRRHKKVARGSKTPARKVAAVHKRAVSLQKRVAKEILGPVERVGESVVVAARRLWLSADSLLSTRGGSGRRPKRKTRPMVSR
jgi:hypothetical protein